MHERTIYVWTQRAFQVGILLFVFWAILQHGPHTEESGALVLVIGQEILRMVKGGPSGV